MKYRIYVNILLIFSTIALMACSTPSPKGPSDYMQELGLKELVPPSTLAPPATFVEVRSEIPLIIDIACEARDAFGDDIPVLTSDTQDITIDEKRLKNVGLNANLFNKIKGEAKYRRVTNITYSLSNTQLIEINPANLFRLRNQLTGDCADSLDFSWSQGRRVSVIRKVLKADGEYEFTFDTSAGITVETQKELIEDLSVRLGADSSTAGERSVKGKSLYWGVHDDVDMACRLAEDSCTPVTGSSRGGVGGNSIWDEAEVATITP